MTVDRPVHLDIPAWVRPPAYASACLGGVLPAAARACGIAVAGAPDAWNGPGGAHHAVCVVLADGLGAEQIAERPGHAPFLARQPRHVLQAGFPSTTVASLGTLGTGLAPGVTGLAGYSLRDPATGRRTTLIGWETPTPPRVWQPHPTYFERLAEAGSRPTFIGQHRFHRSPMTLACLRGARFVTAGSASERVAAAVAACAGGGVVYLYWGELDKAGHAHGWQSRQWIEALEVLDRAMRDLRAGLPARVALWVTADHGMVDTDPRAAIDVAAHRALADGVTMVAGEARALHVYGDNPEAIAQRWQDFLEADAWVMTKDDAIDLGLFGPRVADRVMPMLGDVIVAVNGRGAIVDSRTASPASLAMVGQHGSLTAAEMDIPLIDAAA